jgi:hypothetical protein
MTLTFDIPDALIQEVASAAVKKAIDSYVGIGRSEWDKVPGRDAIQKAVKKSADAMDLTPILARVLPEVAEQVIREAAIRDLSKRAKVVYARHRDAGLFPPDPEAVKGEILASEKGR